LIPKGRRDRKLFFTDTYRQAVGSISLSSWYQMPVSLGIKQEGYEVNHWYLLAIKGKA
jgi:hypothetical protein